MEVISKINFKKSNFGRKSLLAGKKLLIDEVLLFNCPFIFGFL
jgi:hypothetical protein